MKFENLYNVQALDSFADGVEMHFGDAAGAGVVLNQNLEHIDPKIFEKKYPGLTFVNSGITVDNTGGYADTIKSLRLLETGDFKIAGDDTSNKGKIGLTGEDTFIKVYTKEGESSWSATDIEKAKLQNINLPQRYVQAHNKLYNRDIDRIGYLGLGTHKGLLNNTVFTSSAASGAIGTLTGLQAYDEVRALIENQWNDSQNTEGYMADNVVFPTSVFNTLMGLFLNTAGTELSVLEALKKNYPNIKFGSTNKAENVGGSTATVAYSSSDDAMKMRIPVPFQVGKIIQVTSFKFHVESMFGIAGLDILEPVSGRILTGF